jgi:Coenzyme PQQ synthesis protein D (PqqD)
MPRFRPAANVVARTVGEELVLLDYEREVYYGLDPVGARIWELLATDSTIASIVDTLVEEYEVTREELQTDVERLMGELERAGLVTRDQ